MRNGVACTATLPPFSVVHGRESNSVDLGANLITERHDTDALLNNILSTTSWYIVVSYIGPRRLTVIRSVK